MEKRTKNPHNEYESCQIISDLLPLYIEGDCSEESRSLIEEHLQTCENCREQLRIMQTPLDAASLTGQKEKTQEISVEQAFKKIKKRTQKQIILTAISTILIISVLIPLITSLYNSIAEDGKSLFNRTERKMAAELMETWKTEGNEAFVEKLNDDEGYKALCENPFIPEEWEADDLDYRTNLYGNTADSYIEIKIGNKHYMISNLLKHDIEADSTSTGKELKNGGDPDAFLYWLITESDYLYLFSQEDYDRLVKKYGNPDTINVSSYPDGDYYSDNSLLKPLDTEYGTYYCRYGHDGGDDANYYGSTGTEFSDDMLDKVEGIEQIGFLYIAAANSDIMPLEIYDYFKETEAKISKWYQEYANYYQSMGLEAYTAAWKSNLLRQLNELTAQYGEITDYHFGSVWRVNGFDTYWHMYWYTTLESGATGLLNLTVENGGTNFSLYDYRINP